jgi:hypothetical protein
VIVEKMRSLLPLLPMREYGAVRRAMREAITHIHRLEARVAEQDKHLEMLRAQLLKDRR